MFVQILAKEKIKPKGDKLDQKIRSAEAFRRTRKSPEQSLPRVPCNKGHVGNGRHKGSVEGFFLSVLSDRVLVSPKIPVHSQAQPGLSTPH